MAKFELTALVHQVLPEQKFSSGFRKRVIVLVDDPNANRPHYAAFEFLKDKADLLERFGEGDSVTVSFYPDARKWTKPSTGEDQWFVSLTGVGIALAGTSAADELRGAGRPSASAPVPPPAVAPESAVSAASAAPAPEMDDLPF